MNAATMTPKFASEMWKQVGREALERGSEGEQIIESCDELSAAMWKP